VRQESEASHQEAIAAFAQDLNATLERAQQGVDQWYSEAEQKLAVLAIEIAQRAISQELSINQEAVLQIAKQVLNEVTTGNHVRLRVNPIQTAILDSRREEILQSISHLRNIEIIADPNISDGLIVESDNGVIDARIETYLQRLTDQVTGEAA
jgi:flagellar assembly protein FliH